MNSTMKPLLSHVQVWLIMSVSVAHLGCQTANQSRQRAVQTGSPAVAAATPNAPTIELVDKALDVPYVPTPPSVVDHMLALAQVTDKDILYDLGSGDGRIVITAAQKYGARGIGYDLNPQRIQESDENARQAGVTDRVRFVQQDLFESDLSGATVVTLYLLPEVNEKLRPKLLRELRPGTRIVSHNYPIGDWEPEDVVAIDVKGVKHYVYLWVVPRRGGSSK